MSPKARTPMSDEHKTALAEGRDQGRAVRRYLEALEANKPRRGRKRSPESMRQRLDAIETELPTADPLKRLHLVQERLNLQAALENSEAGSEVVELSDPLAGRSQLGLLCSRQPGPQAAVDPVLAPPVVDRLITDPATLRPTATRSSTRRRELRRVAPLPDAVLLQDSSVRVQSRDSTKAGADQGRPAHGRRPTPVGGGRCWGTSTFGASAGLSAFRFSALGFSAFSGLGLSRLSPVGLAVATFSALGFAAE